MALGRQGERQTDLMVGWAELPRSPGHAFYDRLQAVLIEAGFDGFAETQCAPYYASRRGRPSLPPGRYFRMHLVGYFEGIDSERGLEWRCSDSLSLREFLRLETTRLVPDHSWLSKTRAAAARGARGGLRLGAGALGGAWPDQGRSDRRRCLDHGGQRRPARDRAA
jgi:transposase